MNKIRSCIYTVWSICLMMSLKWNVPIFWQALDTRPYSLNQPIAIGITTGIDLISVPARKNANHERCRNQPRIQQANEKQHCWETYIYCNRQQFKYADYYASWGTHVSISRHIFLLLDIKHSNLTASASHPKLLYMQKINTITTSYCSTYNAIKT